VPIGCLLERLTRPSKCIHLALPLRPLSHPWMVRLFVQLLHEHLRLQASYFRPCADEIAVSRRLSGHYDEASMAGSTSVGAGSTSEALGRSGHHRSCPLDSQKASGFRVASVIGHVIRELVLEYKNLFRSSTSPCFFFSPHPPAQVKLVYALLTFTDRSSSPNTIPAVHIQWNSFFSTMCLACLGLGGESLVHASSLYVSMDFLVFLTCFLVLRLSRGMSVSMYLMMLVNQVCRRSH
jgi:hypothetical protein